MPDETRTIEPALTPEEWGYRTKEHGDAIKEVSVEIDGGQLCVREWNGNDLQGTTHVNIVKLPPELLPAAAALANAALPDGDPRKITREDAQLVKDAAGKLADCGWHREDEEQLRRIASILAALLPPT